MLVIVSDSKNGGDGGGGGDHQLPCRSRSNGLPVDKTPDDNSSGNARCDVSLLCGVRW